MSTERDDFATVPILEPDGSNWVIWKNHLHFAMAAKGTYEHLTGTATRPTPPDSTEAWDKAEATARWQLARAVKDVTFHIIMGKTLVSEMWTEIKKEFESKSSLVQADLRRKFHEMRCTEKGDVRTHLDNLRAAHAELATVGVQIDDDEYASIILKSLPSVYSNHLASVSAAAHLAGVTLAPATVMSLVLEEYYRRTGNNTQKGKDKESKETALSAQAGGGKANGQKGKKPDAKGQKKEFTGECFNCGGTGHRVRNCLSPKQEKAKNSQ